MHRLDPRAKVAVTAAFLVTAASFPKREVAGLMPLCIYVAAMVSAGRIPLRVLSRYILLASPFAVMVGVFNPIFDREQAASLGPLVISGGWMSFFSIVTRSTLSIAAALVLLGCTGYVGVCIAMGRMGAPRLLVTQFLLLHRFVFVLSEEAMRMARAYALRARSRRPPSLRIWSSLAGHLLLRAYERGLRLHAAMLCRGFDGSLRPVRPLKWRWADSLFVAGWCAFFALARFGNIPCRLGALAVEVLH